MDNLVRSVIEDRALDELARNDDNVQKWLRDCARTRDGWDFDDLIADYALLLSYCATGGRDHYMDQFMAQHLADYQRWRVDHSDDICDQIADELAADQLEIEALARDEAIEAARAA